MFSLTRDIHIVCETKWRTQNWYVVYEVKTGEFIIGGRSIGDSDMVYNPGCDEVESASAKRKAEYDAAKEKKREEQKKAKAEGLRKRKAGPEEADEKEDDDDQKEFVDTLGMADKTPLQRCPMPLQVFLNEIHDGFGVCSHPESASDVYSEGKNGLLYLFHSKMLMNVGDRHVVFGRLDMDCLAASDAGGWVNFCQGKEVSENSEDIDTFLYGVVCVVSAGGEELANMEEGMDEWGAFLVCWCFECCCGNVLRLLCVCVGLRSSGTGIANIWKYMKFKLPGEEEGEEENMDQPITKAAASKAAAAAVAARGDFKVVEVDDAKADDNAQNEDLSNENKKDK